MSDQIFTLLEDSIPGVLVGLFGGNFHPSEGLGD